MSEIIRPESRTLAGKHIRLEPLDLRHVDGLVAAAEVDRPLRVDESGCPPEKPVNLQLVLRPATASV
jgi:hypothetical protein